MMILLTFLFVASQLSCALAGNPGTPSDPPPAVPTQDTAHPPDGAAAGTAAPVLAPTPGMSTRSAPRQGRTPAATASAPPARDVVILMYHHIVPGIASDEYQRSAEDFEADLVHLRDNDYSVVSLDDMLAIREGSVPAPPGRLVVITFDDGYTDLRSYAFPLLVKYDMPATFFVITARIDSEPSLYTNWETLREMSAYRNASGLRLVSVNSHSLTHPFLGCSSSKYSSRADYLDFLTKELGQSKQDIERNIPELDRGAMFLSLPYGDGFGNEDIVRTARNLGYRGIRTSEAFAYDIHSEADFAMPSVPVHDGTDIRDLPSWYRNP